MDLYQFFYGAQSLNHKLFMALNHADSPLLDLLMPVVTSLGDVWIYYFYFALLGGVSLLKPKWLPPRYVVVFILAYFFSLMVESSLKLLFDIPRPALAIGLDNVRVLGKVKLYHALPSGHAVLAFVAASTLSYRRGAGWKVPLYFWGSLMAYSRIYVGAHYPLDVVSGAVVGVVCGQVVWKIFERMRISSKGKT